MTEPTPNPAAETAQRARFARYRERYADTRRWLTVTPWTS